MNWIIYLKTTETCNLNCKHCFTNGISGRKIYWDRNKTVDWLTRFSEETISFEDTIHCEFHGGEPFLVNTAEIRDVCKRVRAVIPQATFGVTSNCVFKLKDEHKDLIRDYFDGRIATSWDPTVRFANKSQMELWDRNVKELKKEFVVKLNISLTKDTLKIPPFMLLSWIKDYKFKEVAFERLTHDGNANIHPDIFPTNKQLDAWFLELHKESEEHGFRDVFVNEFFESIYTKFESGFNGSGTFCRDCEEKIFTVNADGTIAGCPNSAPTESFGNINQSITELINNPIRVNNIACERSRNPKCYDCEVFSFCGGDCHQLSWQGETCGAPKSLMIELKNRKSNGNII